jgi:hypothetical protein
MTAVTLSKARLGRRSQAARRNSTRFADLLKEDAGLKTQYYTSSSLDGFIATEDDSLEWLFPLGDINETSYPSFIEHVGAIAMGSSTYEWLLRNGGTVSEQTGTA